MFMFGLLLRVLELLARFIWADCGIRGKASLFDLGLERFSNDADYLIVVLLSICGLLNRRLGCGVYRIYHLMGDGSGFNRTGWVWLYRFTF